MRVSRGNLGSIAAALGSLRGVGAAESIFQLTQDLTNSMAALNAATASGDAAAATAATAQYNTARTGLLAAYANPPASQAANVASVLNATAPPIVATTPAAVAQACQAGWTVDADGVCSRYSDSALVGIMNTVQWNGDGSIPAEQLDRIQPQVLAKYGQVPAHIVPGSVLAYVYGVGGPAPDGTVEAGDNGAQYQMSGGTWTAYTPPSQSAPAQTVVSGSYTPSSDDLYIYAAIGAVAPYTQSEVTFAQAVEALGSPVSGLFTQTEIAKAYAAGGSVVTAQQSLQTQLASGSAPAASGSTQYPAGTFNTTYAGVLTTSGSGYALIQINSDGSGTVLGSATAAQLQAVTLTAAVQFSGGLYLDAADFAAVKSATGLSSGFSTTTLLLIAAGVGAFFLIKK